MQQVAQDGAHNNHSKNIYKNNYSKEITLVESSLKIFWKIYWNMFHLPARNLIQVTNGNYFPRMTSVLVNTKLKG